MVTMLTASTFEMDDEAFAVDEVLAQLNLANNLKKHAAALMSFSPEFVETGVAQAIAERLPFDVVGTTSFTCMTPAEGDSLMLAICVLTSDEVEFSAMAVSCAGSLDAIGAAYRAMGDGRTGSPSLIVPFLPLMPDVGAEDIMVALDEATGRSVPLFGSVAFDHSAEHLYCFTLLNGTATRDSLVALALWGDIRPAFFQATISRKSKQHQGAVITKSRGSLLIEVDELPLAAYLSSIGINRDNNSEAAHALPLLLDYRDGTAPVGRAMHMLTDQGALCGGLMPENATIAVGTLTPDEVARIVDEVLSAVAASDKHQGLLLFPCGSYVMVAGVPTGLHKIALAEKIGGKMPYLLSYSGGEICPVRNDMGLMRNHYNSFTFVACAF